MTPAQANALSWRFETRVSDYARVWGASMSEARYMILAADWRAAEAEQRERLLTVAKSRIMPHIVDAMKHALCPDSLCEGVAYSPTELRQLTVSFDFEKAFNTGQRKAADSRWLATEYGMTHGDAIAWVERGVYVSGYLPIIEPKRIRNNAFSVRLEEIRIGKTDWLDTRIAEHATTSAERHRDKRVKHAQTVCAPGGAFDAMAVPLGVSITVGERLERLEAAVLLMAAHDPTGPIKSARDFLSLIVTDKLRNVLLRRVVK